MWDQISGHADFERPYEGSNTGLKTSPFRQHSGQLLFPFLVLEAKSEKGQDNFNAIQRQTVFTIRTLLNMQVDLQQVTGELSTCLRGPLVWSFASKREQWQVAAGYTVEDDVQTPHYVRQPSSRYGHVTGAVAACH